MINTASPNVVIKSLPNLASYNAPQHFGEELAYFATEDDRALGVVLRNHIDKG